MSDGIAAVEDQFAAEWWSRALTPYWCWTLICFGYRFTDLEHTIPNQEFFWFLGGALA